MSRIDVVVNQWQDNEGRVLPNCQLFSYEVGSNIPKDTYTDSAFTTPNSNPVVADGAGRLFDVFLDGGYRLVLEDEDGNTVWDVDNVFANVDGSDLTNLQTQIDQNSVDITNNTASYTASGPANTYTLTIQGGLTQPDESQDGQRIYFTPNVANSGSSTVDTGNGEGAVGLRLSDGVTVLPGNFLQTNRFYGFVKSGTIYKNIFKSGTIENSDIENDAVTTDKILDGAVTLEKQASGTPGKGLVYGAGGVLEETDLATRDWVEGQTIDLTNAGANDTNFWSWDQIPSTAIAMKIVLNDASVLVADDMAVTFTDSGGEVITNYNSLVSENTAANYDSSTVAFLVTRNGAVGDENSGTIYFDLQTGNDWTQQSNLMTSAATNKIMISSGIQNGMANPVEEINLKTVGGQFFDNGTATFWYLADT